MREPGAGFPLSLYQPWEAILRIAISTVVRGVYGESQLARKKKEFQHRGHREHREELGGVGRRLSLVFRDGRLAYFGQRCLHTFRCEWNLPDARACGIEDRIADGGCDDRDGGFACSACRFVRSVEQYGVNFRYVETQRQRVIGPPVE